MSQQVCFKLLASFIIHTVSSQLCDIDGSSSTYSENLNLNDNIRQIEASGCPNHDNTCVGKPGTCTYRGESLNVTLSTHQNKSIEIPAVPCISDLSAPYDITCVGGQIGILLNGASVFSQTAGGDECEDAVVAEFTAFSMCGGHATPGGEWHHHVLPSCLLAQLGDYGETNPNNQHSPQIGWSFDGFPIYGPHGVDGKKMYKCTDSRANPDDCLDECNGQGVYPGAINGGHIIDGYTYHYHVTGPVANLSGDIRTSILDPAPDASMAPYTIGCWRGISPRKPAAFRNVECAYPGTTDDFVPRVIQGVSEYIFPDIMPPTTAAPTPSPTAIPTEIPTAAPSASPIDVTQCVSVSDVYPYVVDGVKKRQASDVSLVNGYRDDAKGAFCSEDSDCMDPSEVNEMDYVYKIDYRGRTKELTVNLVVCCGEGRQFSAEQLDEQAALNYHGEDAAFNVFFIGEDETLGAKEIIVICIICLLVIAAFVGAVYWYKQKRRGQVSFEESPSNQTTGNSMKTVETENNADTKIEMRISAPSAPAQEDKKSPLTSNSMQNDPYKVVDGDLTVR